MAQCTNDQSRVWYHSAIQAPNRAPDLFCLEIVIDVQGLIQLYYSYMKTENVIGASYLLFQTTLFSCLYHTSTQQITLNVGRKVFDLLV